MNAGENKAHAAALTVIAALTIFLGFKLSAGLLAPRAQTAAAQFFPVVFDPAKEPPQSKAFETFLKDLEQKKAVLPAQTGRDLFEEWKNPPMLEIKLRIESIESQGPPFFYQGVMEDVDGVIIAQVNIQGRSYFLKPGESAQKWVIQSISPEKVEVKSPEGEDLTFLFRGATVKPKEVWAVLVKEPEKTLYKIKEGDTIENFKVLQIGDSMVKIQAPDGKELTIVQGSEGVIIDRIEQDERSPLNDIQNTGQ